MEVLDKLKVMYHALHGPPPGGWQQKPPVFSGSWQEKLSKLNESGQKQLINMGLPIPPLYQEEVRVAAGKLLTVLLSAGVPKEHINEMAVDAVDSVWEQEFSFLNIVDMDFMEVIEYLTTVGDVDGIEVPSLDGSFGLVVRELYRFAIDLEW